MATQMVGRSRWSAERRFYTFMTLAIFVAVYVGFASHKRLMLIGSIAIINAALARCPMVFDSGGPVFMFVLANLFLVPLVIWDLKTRGRLHPATLWGGLLVVASQPLRLWLLNTETSFALAGRLL